MRQSKLTDQQRLDAVRAYLAGAGSYQTLAEQYGISVRTLRDLVALCQAQGEQALCTSKVNTYYPPELKRRAVDEYKSGQSSQRDICLKYNIRTRSQLRAWVRQYSDPDLPFIETQSPPTPRSDGHTTGRKTSFDERIESVCFYLANGRDYHLTAETFGVSYQQIYKWVQKYLAHGCTGLLDRRGKAKDDEMMTPLERLQAENRMLRAEIRHLKAENLALKKLRQRERRWG